MRILFSTVAKYISLGLNSFLDNFAARSNTTGGLGTATDGNEWEAINGTINVVSGAAKASSIPTSYSSGSNYPMSTVTMANSDVDIKLKGVNQGSTGAIWVRSSDEWWGVTSRADQQTIPGNTNYGLLTQATGNFNYFVNYWYNWSAPYTYGGSGDVVSGSSQVAYFVYGFNSSTTYGVANYSISYSASYGTRYNSKYSLAYTKYTWSTTNANYKATGTNYGYRVNSTYYKNVSNYKTYYWNASGSNSGQSSNPVEFSGTNYGYYYGSTGTNATTYAIRQYVDVIRSVAGGTVSTITSWLVSTSQTISSILISLSGNTITVKPYSDANLVSQIGSNLVYNATGAIIETRFGISLSPSEYLQSDIIATSAQIDVI